VSIFLVDHTESWFSVASNAGSISTGSSKKEVVIQSCNYLATKQNFLAQKEPMKGLILLMIPDDKMTYIEKARSCLSFWSVFI